MTTNRKLVPYAEQRGRRYRGVLQVVSNRFADIETASGHIWVEVRVVCSHEHRSEDLAHQCAEGLAATFKAADADQ